MAIARNNSRALPSNALNTFESLQFVNKPNGMIGAMDNTDSLKKNSISVSIKAGRPMTIFLNNYSQNNNFTPIVYFDNVYF